MKRRTPLLILVITILSSLLLVPVHAADTVTTESETTTTPRYVNISSFYATCSVNSNGKALCYALVDTANSTYTIYLNITLQRYEDGEWSSVKTWSGSGTGVAELNKSRYVTSGHYYRTAATATVYTSGGSYVESATIYSQSDYY